MISNASTYGRAWLRFTTRRSSWRFAVLLVVLSILVLPRSSGAAVLAAPAGGAPIPLPPGHSTCGVPGDDWQVEEGGRKLRPPTNPEHIGKVTQIRVAGPNSPCSTSKITVDVAATGPLPSIDRRSIDLWLDEGHLDVKGASLDGARLEWDAKGEVGSDLCVANALPNGQQSCAFAVSKQLALDAGGPVFRLLPVGAPPGAAIHDISGRRLKDDELSLVPARIILGRVLASERLIDLSTGSDRLGLNHANSVVYADCDNSRCELVDNGIDVRSVTGSVRTVTLRIRLAPRVYVRQGETLSPTATVSLGVTYCPVTVVSPPPIRDTDEARVLVRVDARCGADSDAIHWTANGSSVPVLETESVEHAVYMLLGVGRVTTDKLTLAAMRNAQDASIIAVTTLSTAPAPELRVQLHLPGYGEIDFVPTNREAILSATAPNLRGKIVAIPVRGVYAIRNEDGQTRIRGEVGGGYVALRFALRDEGLPGRMAQADLAHLHADVQRAVKEVNIAVPLGVAETKEPIAEVLCTSGLGRPLRVIPGVPLHIPFAQRDGCRLIIHRERIPVENGEQRLNVSVSVNTVAGSARPEGNFNQRLQLRHGPQARVIWIGGVKSQFDRITVRVAHAMDESQYLNGGGERIEVPAGQWMIVVENTRWRLYATAAIPVQLFRFSGDPGGAGTGPLSLNMGVLTRFTWVTPDGAEGILGLEGGVMAMGLAGQNTHQLNVVGGIGFGVPLGNAGQPSQTSINIHAWAAYRLGNQTGPRLDASGNAIPGELINLNHWAFIFGPSVTMGNLGFDI